MPTPSGEILDFTPLDFGKHKGKTPDRVSEEDPSYIVWLWNTFNPKKTSKLLYEACMADLYEKDADSDDDRAPWERES